MDDSALPDLGRLNFGFYPFPFKWYFEKSRKCLRSFFKICHLKFICEASKHAHNTQGYLEVYLILGFEESALNGYLAFS